MAQWSARRWPQEKHKFRYLYGTGDVEGGACPVGDNGILRLVSSG